MTSGGIAQNQFRRLGMTVGKRVIVVVYVGYRKGCRNGVVVQVAVAEVVTLPKSNDFGYQNVPLPEMATQFDTPRGAGLGRFCGKPHRFWDNVRAKV